MSEYSEIIQTGKQEQQLSFNQSISMEEQENKIDILKWDPEKEKQKNSFINNLEFMPPKLDKKSVVKAPQQEKRSSRCGYQNPSVKST